jgi:type II secretory pathway pseudopilin PulG
MQNIQSKQKSFGLIEVVVSVGIIALVLGALIGLASTSVKTSVSAENRLKAAYLAREGVELARQVRDTARLIPAPLTGCYDFSSNNKYYDYPTKCLVSISPPSIYQIINADGSVNAGVSTAPSVIDQYGREILVEDIGGGTLFKVTSSVVWIDFGGTPRTTSVVSYLAKWW